MESKLEWNELEIVLAIARTGSLAGAARRLGVSHATIFRHLNAVENTLGVTLFQRHRNRYTATAAGDVLSATAATVEANVLDAERRLAGHEIALSGTIRLTTTDTLLYGLLAPIFANFQAEYPQIVLDVSISNTVFSLSRRDADVAIRPGQDPNEHLVGRRIGTIEQAVYAATDHRNGDPASAGQRWIGTSAGMGYSALESWMIEQGVEPLCRSFTNTLLATQAVIAAGAGIAVLPCYLADPDKRLRRLGAPVARLATDLWLLIHPDLKRVAQFKVFNDFVFNAARERLVSIGNTRSPAANG